MFEAIHLSAESLVEHRLKRAMDEGQWNGVLALCHQLEKQSYFDTDSQYALRTCQRFLHTQRVTMLCAWPTFCRSFPCSTVQYVLTRLPHNHSLPLFGCGELGGGDFSYAKFMIHFVRCFVATKLQKASTRLMEVRIDAARSGRSSFILCALRVPRELFAYLPTGLCSVTGTSGDIRSVLEDVKLHGRRCGY